MTQSHMAREVAEIPEAAQRFLTLSAEATAKAAEAMRQADPALIVTVARGSSDHAATYLKYAVELLAGVPVASVGPSVASIYGRPLRVAASACIGISQSGQSPDIVEMMRAAGAGGALTLASPPGEARWQPPRLIFLALHRGRQSVAATKTLSPRFLPGWRRLRMADIRPFGRRWPACPRPLAALSRLSPLPQGGHGHSRCMFWCVARPCHRGGAARNQGTCGLHPKVFGGRVVAGPSSL